MFPLLATVINQRLECFVSLKLDIETSIVEILANLTESESSKDPTTVEAKRRVVQ